MNKYDLIIKCKFINIATSKSKQKPQIMQKWFDLQKMMRVAQMRFELMISYSYRNNSLTFWAKAWLDF